MVEYYDIQSTDEKYGDIDVRDYDNSENVILYRGFGDEEDMFYINEGERDELAELLSTEDDGENNSRERYESENDDDREAETFDGDYYRHEWSSGDIEMSVESDDPEFVKMVLGREYTDE